MEKRIKELLANYTAIKNQSHLMMTRLDDKIDRAKVEAGATTLDMVIDDLKTALKDYGF